MAASPVAWTRCSCCASLPGLRNRFWQCPQKCSVPPCAAGVEPAALAGPSDALLEAMASIGPSSSCRRETWLGGGGRAMTLDVGSVAVAVAFPGLFSIGSPSSASDRLRLHCFGGNVLSAPIVAWGRSVRGVRSPTS